MGGVGIASVAADDIRHPPVVGTKVVDVGTLAMCDFAEETSAVHFHKPEVERVVTAVLKHGADALCVVGGFDELPTFLYGGGGRHLYGHILALLHGVYGDGRVAFPVGADEDDVDVRLLTQLLPAVGRGEYVHLTPFFGRKQSECLVDGRLTQVADGCDASVGDALVASQSSNATLT